MPSARAPRPRKTLAAARLLAYKLLRRVEAGHALDPDAALRLVDSRLAPAAADREWAASEALRLSASIRSERRPGGRLAGELRFDLRVFVPAGGGRRRPVTVPLRVHHADGTISVVAAAPSGAEEREAERLRDYRRASEAVFGRSPGGRPVEALLAGADGRLSALPPRPPSKRRAPRRPGGSLASRTEGGRVEAEDVLGAAEGDPGAGAGARRP